MGEQVQDLGRATCRVDLLKTYDSLCICRATCTSRCVQQIHNRSKQVEIGRTAAAARCDARMWQAVGRDVIDALAQLLGGDVT